MAKKWSTFLWISIVLSPAISGQPLDSVQVFHPTDFLNIVLTHHPVVQQAGLLDAQSEAYTRMMRGSFDPKVYSDIQQKSFKGSDYFTLSESGIKAPSWYGLSLKGAFTTASGINLNPENKLPAGGQAVAGISASLARGLVFDDRRAGLQQARINARSNEAEKRRIINDLAMEALAAYWEWSAAFARLDMLEQAVGNARQRQAGITESFRQGDKPAIDTLEAFLLVQSRQMELTDAALEYQKAGIAASGYLWDDQGRPLALTQAIRPLRPEELPPPVLPADLDEWLNRIPNTHPAVQIAQQKIRSLEVEKRLNAEQLKPRLDVEYNLLGDKWRFGYDPDGGNSNLSNVLFQNYKWGLQFEYPLFTRKERGKVELTRVKLLDAQFGLRQKSLDITNKIRQYHADLAAAIRQLTLAENMLTNYQTLLDAELRKFEIGESSVFLLNSREQKLIEARMKRIKLQAECRKLSLAFLWAAGELGG